MFDFGLTVVAGIVLLILVAGMIFSQLANKVLFLIMERDKLDYDFSKRKLLYEHRLAVMEAAQRHSENMQRSLVGGSVRPTSIFGSDTVPGMEGEFDSKDAIPVLDKNPADVSEAVEEASEDDWGDVEIGDLDLETEEGGRQSGAEEAVTFIEEANDLATTLETGGVEFDELIDGKAPQEAEEAQAVELEFAEAAELALNEEGVIRVVPVLDDQFSLQLILSEKAAIPRYTDEMMKGG